MKKIKLFSLFFALALVAQAVPMVTLGTFGPATSGNYTATPNAEFAYVLDNYAPNARNATSFGTFCLEETEYFNPGYTYNVTLNDRAVLGGVTPTPGFDRLSLGTVWLYNKFATGTLNSFGFVYSNSTAAVNLQNVIWALESESGGTINSLWTSVLNTQFGSVSVAKADAASGQFGVMAMNLTSNGVNKQDQLVYVGEQVPDSASTMFLLSGIMGVLGMVVHRKD